MFVGKPWMRMTSDFVEPTVNAANPSLLKAGSAKIRRLGRPSLQLVTRPSLDWFFRLGGRRARFVRRMLWNEPRPFYGCRGWDGRGTGDSRGPAQRRKFSRCNYRDHDGEDGRGWAPNAFPQQHAAKIYFL